MTSQGCQSKPKPLAPLNLLTLNPTTAQALAAKLGWPAYRATQLLRWLYRERVRNIEQMTNLSKADRGRLSAIAHIERFPATAPSFKSADGTRKFLFTLADGLTVESVLIPDGPRLTLCLSTQVGCTLDCGFCLTGQMGLRRNLASHEIADQVLTVLDSLDASDQLTNLVLMGMGEPLANFDAVADAVKRLANPSWGLGFSTRRMTLSTAGLASRLQDAVNLGVNLAVSLNAPTDVLRTRLMPAANRIAPLPELLDACRKLTIPERSRITFEYVLLAGINDREEQAAQVATLLRSIPCKINLIPFNDYPGSPYRRPDQTAVHRFQLRLRSAGYDVLVRRSRGRDVLGACGQLGQLAQASSLPVLTPAPRLVRNQASAALNSDTHHATDICS